MGKKMILVFNVGSSSIKYSLFNSLELISSGDYEKLKTKEDYKEVVRKIFKTLDEKEIDLIIHRVVHGGDLKKPTKIDKNVKDKIREFSELAPLHNPNELMVISLCEVYKNPNMLFLILCFFQIFLKLPGYIRYQRK